MTITTRLILTAFAGCVVALASWNIPIKVKLPPIAKELNKQYSYIPSGSCEVDSATISVRNFYMSKTEVSNAEYTIFLNELKAADRTADYQVAKVDSLGWKMIYDDAYVQYYHQHPAYKDYPVVNVSYEAAILYCKWLTEKWNKASRNGLVYEFRLPHRAEFVYAAAGKTYAWADRHIRNNKGVFRCNFTPIGDEAIRRDPKTGQPLIVTEASLPRLAQSLDDKVLVTAPVIFYAPNVYGLYNMNGNAAEMIAQKGTAVGGDWSCPGHDVRNQSTQTYKGPSPKVGFRPVMVVTVQNTGK